MARKLYYPKIPDSKDFPLSQCIAFEKLDGTNVHFDWERKRGWHAWGTRRDSFPWDGNGFDLWEQVHPQLNMVESAFIDSLANPLMEQFLFDPRCATWRNVRCFGEYLGPRSFAGQHRDDETKRIVLFDVEVDEQLLDPWEFVELFGELPIPRKVFQGKFTGNFAESVRAGNYGVTEGVVCKCGRRGSVSMAKIKTDAYLMRLKQSFGGRWRDYWE